MAHSRDEYTDVSDIDEFNFVPEVCPSHVDAPYRKWYNNQIDVRVSAFTPIPGARPLKPIAGPIPAPPPVIPIVIIKPLALKVVKMPNGKVYYHPQFDK